MIIDYWYDKNTKSWVVQRKNNRGDQIGNADYVYSKEEALKLAKEYNEEANFEYENRKPFLEFEDLPKIFIGDVEIPVRSLKRKSKTPKRVTQFSKYKR